MSYMLYSELNEVDPFYFSSTLLAPGPTHAHYMHSPTSSHTTHSKPKKVHQFSVWPHVDLTFDYVHLGAHLSIIG